MELTKIYCATNKTNGKIYIGKTTESMSERVRKHFVDAKRRNFKFANALKKYGKDGFDFDVLMEVENKFASETEKRYIAYFNSRDSRIGYNTAVGGEGNKGYKFTESQLKQLSDSHKGKPVPQRRKTINVFDSEGNLINQVKGQAECVSLYGAKRTSIDNNLNGRAKAVNCHNKKLIFKYK